MSIIQRKHYNPGTQSRFFKQGNTMFPSIFRRISTKEGNSILTGLLYGLINGVMLIPITISFCTIIYQDKGFERYLPQLVKLVMFSSMIHQWAFTYFSSLPFAIGQVQDAGLIFLSAMAADIVANCAHEDQIVPTAIVVLPICTFLLGIMLVIVAKLRLATVIQYLPMPVIGGYLAYIGFFCGQAGLAMMAGVQVTNITEWGNFYNERAIVLLAPGVALGITTYLLLCNVRSPYVLPSCMIGIVSLFFGCLYLSGMSLHEAREFGWVAPLATPQPFYHSWALYNFSLVDWNMLPQQILRLISMFLVVAFSSSLDVAAIEMEMGLPLDYNRELNTVGLANIFSGLTGGYTGSYIFSQTIFTMRRGVYSRINGYTVVLCEALLILTPISVISYLPKLFFGSLLVMIASDLLMEWLVVARHKMATMEYVVCLLTFVAIQGTGIEIGMFIGILLAMASFVVSYSSLQSVSCASLQTSTVIRTFEERAALIAHRGKVVTITLKGYIFFGSAVKILEDVKSHVSISVPELSPQQLMEQQLALKSEHTTESTSNNNTNNNSSISETTALLAHTHTTPEKKNFSYNTDTTEVTSFPQLDRSIFSFQRSANSSIKNKPKSTTNTTTTTNNATNENVYDTTERQASTDSTHSAAKRLFPDITIPLSPVVSEVSPTPVVASSHGLSVYDMTPEMLQYIIEEKNREFHEHNNDSFHTRENSGSGGITNNNNVCSSNNNTQAHSLARTVYPGVNTSSLPITGSIQPVNVDQSMQPSCGDIEMGASNEVSTPSKSLLTAGIRGEPTNLGKNKTSHPVSNSVTNSDTTTQVAHSVEKARHAHTHAHTHARPFPLPVPIRQAKTHNISIPAPATTTVAMSLPTSTITNNNNNNNNINNSYSNNGRPSGATRHVSFDNDLPNTEDYIIGHAPVLPIVPQQLPPRTAHDSVLATIWEQQASRRRRPSLPSSSSPARAASTSALATFETKEAPKLKMSESLQILRMPSNESVDNHPTQSVSASPQSFPPPLGMIRERSFQEEYQATKSRRKAGHDNLHIPATPPPELVLQSLAREQKHREQQQMREMEQKESEAEIMTEYLVLDFTAVLGIDATATRSCFLMLVQLMRSARVTVVFANMRAHLEALFRAHKVIGPNDIVIPLLDDALEWCEEQVLSKAGIEKMNVAGAPYNNTSNTLTGPSMERNASFYSRAGHQRQQLVRKTRLPTYSKQSEMDLLALGNTNGSINGVPLPPGRVVSAAVLRNILEDYLEVDSAAHPQLRRLLRSELLVKYFQRVTVKAKEILFDVDQLADRIYFIESGEVEIVTVGPSELASTGNTGVPVPLRAETDLSRNRDENLVVVRVNKVSAGGAFGEADFLLGKNHSVQAHTMSDCVFWTLDRDHYVRMELHQPSLCLLIQHSLLKSLAIASTCALYAQHPTAAYTNDAALH